VASQLRHNLVYIGRRPSIVDHGKFGVKQGKALRANGPGEAAMQHSTLKLAGCLLASVVFGGQVAEAAEPAYPSRPIRIIVPTSTGGGGDLSSRLIAQRLFDRAGHSVIVENRAGAGTIVGTDIVAKAPADGHTILMAPGAFATNPSTYKKMPFDTVNDFGPHFAGYPHAGR
jgi:tripartite-type tricarboxylate transporter receptor subunit TctC